MFEYFVVKFIGWVDFFPNFRWEYQNIIFFRETRCVISLHAKFITCIHDFFSNTRERKLKVNCIIELLSFQILFPYFLRPLNLKYIQIWQFYANSWKKYDFLNEKEKESHVSDVTCQTMVYPVSTASLSSLKWRHF